MRYDADVSTDSSTMILLFTFIHGDDVYRYNTSEEIITVGAVEYSPLRCFDLLAMSEDQDSRSTSFTIKTEVNAEPVQLFHFGPSAFSVQVIVDLYDAGDSSNTDRVISGWLKAVEEVEDQEGEYANIHVGTMFSFMEQNGFGHGLGPLCQHTVYGSGCNLNPYDFGVAFPGALASDGGKKITQFFIGADTYAGGLAWITVGSKTEVRGVVAQTGDTIELTRPFSVGENISAVTVYAAPGCDRSEARCEYFNNKPQRLSFEIIPTVNPYTQGLK